MDDGKALLAGNGLFLLVLVILVAVGWLVKKVRS